ncbi:hypothetical protein CBS147346_5709 [Aspergillus niger]|nr:hypothetical protein CBS147346_5709 [Aspergillus niger]
MFTNSSHANGASQKPVDGLIRQVAQAADSFHNSHDEADRLAALQAAQKLVEAFQKPQDAVYNLAYSPTHVMCVRIAMDLGIFSTLSERNGPVTLEDLAATKGADLVLTERVLRILAGIGLSGAVVRFIFDIGMPTLAKVPEFLRMTNFQNPSGAVKGALQYAEKTEMSLWDWVPTKPGFLDACNTFMEADRGSRPSWLEWFPVKERIIDGFHQGESNVLLVDVAGGRGHDLVAFESKFSEVQGRLILEDLPHVVAEATQHPKIEHVSFDLFQAQPIQGARTYYMKFILHDWSDEESRQILSHLAAAMKMGYSKLIIEEFVLADKDCAMLPAMWDWEMLIFCNSMERTASQWTKVLDSAGFRVVKFWAPPGDGQSIIEAELKEPAEPETQIFLEEYLDSEIPEYAILSHTWGKDEISFQDLQALSTGSRYWDRVVGREGFLKIKYVCQQAIRDGLDYAWVDTCCINKSSSAEISEAINSMFQWYKRSRKCYVYLSDIPSGYGEVPLDEQAGSSVEPARRRRPSKYDGTINGPFARCRWFTRGWTLQELIAPKDLTFYGSGWNVLGTKASMTALISTITGIDQRVLRDSTDTKESLRSVCVAQKMSWAARRQTSKIEDEAYCLLGLFDVHMPILYGEGKASFVRLQEEIIKSSDDHTIFAWNYCDIEQESRYTVLAPSSTCFLKNVVQWTCPRNSGPYTMTNRGLHIQLPVIYRSGSKDSCLALLDCHYEDDVTGALALPLTPRSDNTFDIDYDISRGRVVRVDLGLETRATTRDLYIRSQPNVPDRGPQLTCQVNIDQDESRAATLSITEYYPSRIWDAENHRLRLSSNDSTSLETWAAVRLHDSSGRAIGVVFHISPHRRPESTSTFNSIKSSAAAPQLQLTNTATMDLVPLP